MKALLIEFDVRTGKRAGGINPRDRMLNCYGWQDLESLPAKEIRLVEDDRDMGQYRNIQGVTILNGKDAINAAIIANIPVKYSVVSEALMLASFKEKNIKLSEFAGKSMSEIADMAFKAGVAGVVRQIPRTL